MTNRSFPSIEKHTLPAVIKYIEGFDCFWSLLFVSKDQVNPFVQVLRNVLALLQDETTVKWPSTTYDSDIPFWRTHHLQELSCAGK